MRKLFILAALAACCVATPLHSHEEDDSKEHILSVPLQRPSPISPDVPSDPKPTETVVRITDPKEVAKYKRETSSESHEHSVPLIPTVQPGTYSNEQESHESQQSHESHEDQLATGAAPVATHNRQRRDHNTAAVDEKNPSPVAKKAVKKDNPNAPKRPSSNGTPAPAHTKKTAPAPDTQKHRQRREVQAHPAPSTTVAAVPLIHRDERNKPPQLAHDVPHQTVDSQQQPAHLPASKPVKRDIPVPLVPKYHHPEESPKSDEKQVDKDAENKKTEKDSNKSVESDENKHSAEQKKSTDSKENSNESQKPVAHHAVHPLQAPHHPYAEQHPVEEKPNDAAAVSSSSSTSTTSTEHPVIRQKPVPVAELFSRPRQ